MVANSLVSFSLGGGRISYSSRFGEFPRVGDDNDP
jgi:hypothetical protein